jgi:GDPmannose 4,6-dehydratase
VSVTDPEGKGIPLDPPGRSALIVGITGQDGSYLAELLLDKGYEVHGTIRRSSSPNTDRLEGFAERLHLHHADLTDASSLARVVRESQPDEVYNLGALSDVRVSFDVPEFSGDVTGLGCVRLLEVLRQERPQARFYQAGSSEMFGTNPNVPTDERGEFRPASPYACAKAYAHHMTVNYRDSYGMFACNGILFNHESERRGEGFVTRKITKGIADIVHGRAESLVLGNLTSSRDWGHARDFVRAMWLMLQQDDPGDYVVATGWTWTVQDFLEAAFGLVGLDWQTYVRTDPRYLRPVDPPLLLGDASKAREVLGWEPEIGFGELVRLMVDSDLKT